MEVEGLRRALNDMKDAKLRVNTIATDNHLMVGKMMREEFPKVRLLLGFPA